jgi:hypothetical protein
MDKKRYLRIGGLDQKHKGGSLKAAFGDSEMNTDQRRSNRSKFITLSHAVTKSVTNFACESLDP